MGDKEKLSYRPGMVLQGVYKSYGPRFGFLITDEEHEDVYIADRDHLNAVNNDIVEVQTKVFSALSMMRRTSPSVL